MLLRLSDFTLIFFIVDYMILTKGSFIPFNFIIMANDQLVKDLPDIDLQGLNKKSIKDFICQLRRFSHHIFVLIINLSVDKFAITRCRNYYVEKAGKRARAESYSFREFYKNSSRFHRNDEFIVTLGEGSVFFEEELTGEVFEILYMRFLRGLCEQALRNNTPILLTPEIIRKYKLTRRDVSHVKKYLDYYNAEAVNKLQKEYDVLKNLKCIKK